MIATTFPDNIKMQFIRFYLAQANQSFPDHLTNTFTFSFSLSSFGAHLESAPSSISASS